MSFHCNVRNNKKRESNNYSFLLTLLDNFARGKIKRLVAFHILCLPVCESNRSISLMLPIITNQVTISS